MTALYLSRAALRRDPDVASLAPLLLPDTPHARVDAGHRLLWSLFADDADRKRDFLWREQRQGGFLLLSERPPEDRRGLFNLETRPFAPALAAGDVLGFSLRANPVVSFNAFENGKRKVKRHDVVMHALRDVPKGEARAAARPRLVREAGLRWLLAQGGRHGFALLTRAAGEHDGWEDGELLPDDRALGLPAGERYHCAVDGYETLRLPRRGEKPVELSVIEFDGLLRVTDVAAFGAMLRSGLGKAKAFGCGLLLIRRH